MYGGGYPYGRILPGGGYPYGRILPGGGYPYDRILPGALPRHYTVPPRTTNPYPPYGSPPPPITFDDDELLPALLSPPPLPPSSSPSAVSTVTTHPEYPAIAASSSPSSFAVLVQVRAPPAPASTRDRTPIDLVAVLDISGSMFGNKIALVKRAVGFIIDTLSPSDRLSIVSFSSTANRVLNLSCMTEIGRARAFAALDSLAASGGTNIKDGLELGVHVLDQCRHRNTVAGLILLSDGQDSYSMHGQLGQQVNSYSYLLPNNTQVPIHTFGFGVDHDPRAMHTISDASGGTFSFIEAQGDVQDAFAMCIGGLLSVAAQKVELMVSSADGVKIASVSAGSYRSRVIGHGLAAVVEFGDLYADEEKDILVHVSIPVSGVQPVMQLLSVKCSYKEPLTQQAVHIDGEAATIRRPEFLSPEDAVVSLRVDRQRNRLLVGESIKEAQQRAERKDFDGAKAVLNNRRVALLATPSAQAGDGLSGWLETELAEIEKRMANMRVYEESGRAYALAGMASHLQQRAAAGVTMSSARAFNGEAAAQAAGGCYGASLSYGSASSARGSDRDSDNMVGYQTHAMRRMVARSNNYKPQERLVARNPNLNG